MKPAPRFAARCRFFELDLGGASLTGEWSSGSLCMWVAPQRVNAFVLTRTPVAQQAEQIEDANHAIVIEVLRTSGARSPR